MSIRRGSPSRCHKFPDYRRSRSATQANEVRLLERFCTTAGILGYFPLAHQASAALRETSPCKIGAPLARGPRRFRSQQRRHTAGRAWESFRFRGRKSSRALPDSRRWLSSGYPTGPNSAGVSGRHHYETPCRTTLSVTHPKQTCPMSLALQAGVTGSNPVVSTRPKRLRRKDLRMTLS